MLSVLMTILFTKDGTSGAVEFQTIRTRVLSDGFIGNQFAELDSHCRSDRNLDTRVSIFKELRLFQDKLMSLNFSLQAEMASDT